MKSVSKIIFCLIAVILIVSCKKKKENIKYSDWVYYGTNILSLDDGNLVQTANYGMGAVLGKKAKVKIVMTNLSTHTNTNMPAPSWFYSSNTGWVITDYNSSNNTQTFTSTQLEKIDVELSFEGGGGQGSCKIEVYENSNSVTKTKYFTW